MGRGAKGKKGHVDYQLYKKGGDAFSRLSGNFPFLRQGRKKEERSLSGDYVDWMLRNEGIDRTRVFLVVYGRHFFSERLF